MDERPAGRWATRWVAAGVFFLCGGAAVLALEPRMAAMQPETSDLEQAISALLAAEGLAAE